MSAGKNISPRMTLHGQSRFMNVRLEQLSRKKHSSRPEKTS
uniref:Uncharacterized protein n=1 Tax=Rhizophora mucronata TaxID=61149 RepID=A0A2P2QL82_RHIMU